MEEREALPIEDWSCWKTTGLRSQGSVEHVGKAPSHNPTGSKKVPKVCIESEHKGAPEWQSCGNRHDKGETVPSRAKDMVQHAEQQRLQL